MKTYYHIIVLLVILLGYTNSAIALPRMNDLLQVPNTNLFVFESQFNGQAGYDGPLRAYFLPERTKLDKMGEKVFFSYVPKGNGTAEVSFRIRLEAHPYLDANTAELIGAIAALYSAPPEKVRISPLDVYETSVDIHMPSEMGEIVSVPGDDFSLRGSLAFRLILDRNGTRWLRDTVVKRGMEFGTVRGKVDFFDQSSESKKSQEVSIPIYLDELPSCVLTATGC